MDERARRLRRIFIVVQAVTLGVHLVPGFVLCSLIGPGWGAPAAVLLWLITTARIRSLGRDRRRQRWVTRWVDLPVFALWGTALLSTLFFPVSLAATLAVRIVWPAHAGVLAAVFEAATWAYACALPVVAWAVWGRRRLVRVESIDVPVAGLSHGLSGYRIVHLSDLHIGSFDPVARGLVWARLANSLRPDVIAVTGDLVTSGKDFYPDAAEVLGALAARDGVFVSLGNHDQWDDDELTRHIEARGPVVLRNASRVLERGAACLTIAGLDDRYTRKHDIDRALASRRDDGPTVLLSHYPDFFEEAASRSVDLVLSGHTHGGQLGVPWFSGRLNLARLTGQRSRGLYRLGKSSLFVSAGLGTTGPPMRLGVAPEITVLVLRPGQG